MRHLAALRAVAVVVLHHLLVVAAAVTTPHVKMIDVIVTTIVGTGAIGLAVQKTGQLIVRRVCNGTDTDDPTEIETPKRSLMMFAKMARTVTKGKVKALSFHKSFFVCQTDIINSY